MAEVKAPTINTKFACIVDREAAALAAVISSYLFVPGSYLPVLLMRGAKVPNDDDPAFMSEGYFVGAIAGVDGVLISNALARMGDAEYLILAGLSDAQKSYLQLRRRTKIIEIADVSDVESSLSQLGPPREGGLRCKRSDLLKSLFVAQQEQKTLAIDEDAPPTPSVANQGKGIVIVESVADASPVVAINYANSVGASVFVVDSLPEHEGQNVQKWISEWKESGDQQKFEKLRNAITQRVHGISFSRFDYATFFTEGLPYSLILENIIPCSYVHLSLKPDLFVLNSIIFSDGAHFHSAVVFSPTFFLPDEETTVLCDIVRKNSQYLRPLIGQSASVANFDFHAQHFPYDLLHICSHGGEVDGYEISEQFTDRDGNSHFVEFDEVIGFTPVPDKSDMFEVHRKLFPRKLDGLEWRSDELLQRNSPDYVFDDMFKCMVESKGERKKKDRIALSCAIACSDSIHQGEFDVLASHTSPLVFNNSCWSWNEVAAFALAYGARGYIGTLWAIDNQAAVIAAKTFYENLFSGSILSAFFKALRSIDLTVSKDIYIYWGLHFSTLSPGKSLAESHSAVKKELMAAVIGWVSKIASTKSAEVKVNSIKVLKLILLELATNFDSPDVRNLEDKAKRVVPELSQREAPRDREQTELQLRRSSLDLPTIVRTRSETFVVDSTENDSP